MFESYFSVSRLLFLPPDFREVKLMALKTDRRGIQGRFADMTDLQL